MAPSLGLRRRPVVLLSLTLLGCLSWLRPYDSRAVVGVVAAFLWPGRFGAVHTASLTSMGVLQERLSAEEIQSRLQKQLAKLKERDRQSRSLTAEELKVIHEDEHIIVVEKPSGVLCVPTEDGVPSLIQVVYDRCRQHDDASSAMVSMDQMVVHRLGIDTSGLMVFAKSMEAVRGMNTLFRTRNITRQYEALVCGHIPKDTGLINLPLMRDYQYPPFMRISTDEHQRNLLDLDPEVVGHKLLEAPKASITHYQVLAREYLHDQPALPVTRLTLTSISGRTHQLNVHCAAIGHPIVRDAVYGWQGDAAPHGGLDATDWADDAASNDVQQAIAEAAQDMNMCVHAKYIRFRHPVTKLDIECSSSPPF